VLCEIDVQATLKQKLGTDCNQKQVRKRGIAPAWLDPRDCGSALTPTLRPAPRRRCVGTGCAVAGWEALLRFVSSGSAGRGRLPGFLAAADPARRRP